MTSNRLVQIAALTLLLAVLMALVIRSSKNKVDTAVVDNPLPTAGGEPLSKEALAALGLEGDTEKDTVATLIGEVKKLRSDVSRLTEQNTVLREDNAQLSGMENAIQTRLRREIKQAISEGSARQQAKLDAHAARTEKRVRGFLNNAPASFSHRDDIPRKAGSGAASTVWVQPLDAKVVVSVENEQPLGLFGLGGSSSPQDSVTSAAIKPEGEGKEAVVPFYTIPQNATLVGSTALTALVGRVPVGTNVTDPYSFKVIIGRDNLAANGIEIPEVAYAISSGRAVGDWTLGCVRGDLYSITFVFEDGTIRTVPKPASIYEGGAAGQVVKIGEIADRFGNPCVVGKRVTNAYSYLSQRVGVMALSAAAEAAAAAQTTTNTSISGAGLGVATEVTGSRKDYILGRTVSNGAQEVAKWMDQRQSQQFDAIYVPPGHAVALNITEQIEIDYDPRGRKTHYAGVNGGAYRVLD